MRRRNDRILKLIALFRWSKALVLIGAALGALKLLHPGAAAAFGEWAMQLPHVGQHRLVLRAIGRITHLQTHSIEWIGAGMLGYAVLFAVEGTGLWLAKRWGEWLTIVATTSFIPFELYELVRRASAFKAVFLAANVAIVIYLIWRLRAE